LDFHFSYAGFDKEIIETGNLTMSITSAEVDVDVLANDADAEDNANDAEAEAYMTHSISQQDLFVVCISSLQLTSGQNQRVNSLHVLKLGVECPVATYRADYSEEEIEAIKDGSDTATAHVATSTVMHKKAILPADMFNTDSRASPASYKDSDCKAEPLDCDGDTLLPRVPTAVQNSSACADETGVYPASAFTVTKDDEAAMASTNDILAVTQFDTDNGDTAQFQTAKFEVAEYGYEEFLYMRINLNQTYGEETFSITYSQDLLGAAHKKDNKDDAEDVTFCDRFS